MSRISFEQAKENIKRYRDANPIEIKSYWLNKEVIDFIKNAEDLSGIRVYPAMYADGGLNVILSPTKVEKSVKEESKILENEVSEILENDEEDPIQTDTEYFNYSDTCPPRQCAGDIGNEN